MTRVDLGVDTGGTFTDAVLMRDGMVIAHAKALTTRDDLARGVMTAVDRVLTEAAVNPAHIGFAALSTTLATNALVEGHGGRVGLIAIGFDAATLEKGGLLEALGTDPHLILHGGHNHAGEEAAPLDLDRIAEWTGAQDVDAFAIAAQFATRNPAHELAAGDVVRARTGKAVTLSHTLSAKLGGPKRALTALLNARLVSMTHRLIGRAEAGLRDLGIDAALMVVRGDGALMSAAQATERPIETILSGPAASVVGAGWLTGQRDGLVSDIGGTTTDIALVQDGRPRIDPDGAQVGGYRTMVEAVAMRTHGLGGDSAVRPIDSGLMAGVTLGPDRVLPISLLAHEAPQVVHAALDQALHATVTSDLDGAFLRAVPGMGRTGLSDRQQDILDRIATDVVTLKNTVPARRDLIALRGLVQRGLVQRAGVTPTDALHVLGQLETWDQDASEKALALMARRRAGDGARLAPDARALARMIVDEMTRRTGLALLETAFAEDPDWHEHDPTALAKHILMERGLCGHAGLVRIASGLNVPVIGLGASARAYYPAVGTWLGAETILPDLGGVANAIGAVAGQVRVRRQGTVTAPSDGLFRAHLGTGPEDFGSSEAAIERLTDALKQDAVSAALQAGAGDVATNVTCDLRQAEVENRRVLIEATLTVEVTGRPAISL